mmetsp:Transcript_14609/g.24977  ORF Transcript_14609/g.24977 Transcript_14609/m.24977 type:complete len:93 (+) Transcript_14609:327-605(+)
MRTRPLSKTYLTSNVDGRRKLAWKEAIIVKASSLIIDIVSQFVESLLSLLLECMYEAAAASSLQPPNTMPPGPPPPHRSENDASTSTGKAHP